MNFLQETFAPLRNRNLRLYLGGQAVSLTGTWMQMTAQSWVVWRLTGSEAALGLVVMMQTLPLLVLGPIAGTLADRWDRRKIMITTQTLSMILAFILSALVFTNAVRLWHMVMFALALGCLTALDLPSQQAFIGDLSGMEMVRKAVVINAMIVQISLILGSTLAGLVVKAVGEAPAFFLNGVSFLAVIASLFAIRATRHAGAANSRTPGNFMESVRYVVSQPRIMDLMIFTGLVAFFGFPIATILPAFASKTLNGDAGLYGLLMGASGLGAIFSVLFVVPWGHRKKRPGGLLAGSLIFAGIMYTVFSFTHLKSVAIAAYFFTGIPFPLVITTNNGLLQFLAPAQMRARLLTLFLMLSFGLVTIANSYIGWLAKHIGTPAAIRVNAFCMLAIALLMLLRPGLLTWEPVTGRLGGTNPQNH